MPRKLSDESLGEPISPLIDVVMNAFAAMFIILIIFIAVFNKRPLPPTFLEVEPPPLIQGQNYTFTLPVSGGSGQRTFQVIKGDLAALGLSFETNTGTLFGLADLQAKNAPVSFPLNTDCEFEVADGVGRDRRTVKFRMSSGAVPFPETQLSILHQGTTLPGGRIGQIYEAILGASGGVEPYHWQLVSGKLPRGISLDSKQGRLSGRLSERGTFSFEVSAEHSPGTFQVNNVRYNWSGGKSTQRYELDVYDYFESSLSVPVGRVGEEYTGSFVSNGRLPQETLSWTAQVPGLSFSDTNGSITGIPQQPGVFDVAYRIGGVPSEKAIGNGKLHILPPKPSKEAGTITIQTWVDSQTDALIPYRGLTEPVVITNLAPLPDGLIVTGTRLSGTPKQPGTFSVPFAIQDSVGAVTNGAIVILVHPSRQILGLAEQLTVPLVIGSPVAWRPPSIGGEGRTTWTIDGPLPPGLVISNDTLTGTLRTRGVWAGRLTVSDEVAARSVTQNVEFRGITPEGTTIRLATTSIPSVFAGVPFDFVFAAEGGLGIPRFSFTGELPAGLRFTTNGISGTAQTVGDWRVTSTVVDEVEQRDGPRQFTLSVRYDDQSQPSLLTSNIPPAVVGLPFDFVFAAEGGVGIARFSFTGDLPPGLRFTTNGIAGTAQAVGDWRVTSTVYDAVGQRDGPRQFTLSVRYSDQSQPLLLTSSIPPAVVGIAYEFTFSAVGGVGFPMFSFSGDLPRGLRFTATGISGIAREVRETTMEVSATDQTGRKTSARRFAFHSVPNEVTKPEVITSNLRPAIRGERYLHEFAGEGGIGRYRWIVTGDLPQGLKVGAHGIEGTVSREARVGNWNLRLSVGDEAGNLSAERDLQLIVTDQR